MTRSVLALVVFVLLVPLAGLVFAIREGLWIAHDHLEDLILRVELWERRA